MRDIRRAVARAFGKTEDEMMTSYRHARARQAAMLLARDLTSLSLVRIGRELGVTDHGTVHHGIANAIARSQVDLSFSNSLSVARDALEMQRITGIPIEALPRRVAKEEAPAREPPERQSPLVMPKQLSVIRKLRRIGWSIRGIAKQTGLPPDVVERVIDEIRTDAEGIGA